MKKRKISLFIKIFLAIFSGFLVIQVINISNDYHEISRNIVISCIDYDLANELSLAQKEHAKTMDNTKYIAHIENLLKNHQDFSKDKQGYYMFSNGKDEVVKEVLDFDCFQDKPYMIVAPKYSYEYNPIYISLENIGSFQLSLLEDMIMKDGKTKALEIQYSGYKHKIEDDKTGQIKDMIEPTFLKIDNLLLLGKKEKQIEKVFLHEYSSSEIYYRDYTSHEESSPIVMKRQEFLEMLSQSKKKWLDEYTQMINTNIGYERKDDDLILTYEINHYFPENTEAIDDFVFVKYYPNIFNNVMGNALSQNSKMNMLSMLLSIFISLGISYMMTKRIKYIDKSMRMIADNHFDVMLKEKPYDELGTLSHNINVMSQRLKKTMEELNEEIENVKKLESLRKEFIANFTHEIKTPLGIVNGYIELIEAVDDEEKRRQYLNAIYQETDRINELVFAMLNLSRLESGKVELNIEEFDFEDFIVSTIDSFASLLQQKNIQVILDGEEALVHADKVQMLVVMKNLISNAIKHTHMGGNIYIHYDHQMFSIENEGECIDENKMDTIWDTYVSNDREGTGLGLAICKTILDMHGFYYRVENTQRGVCFTISMLTDKE